MVFLKGILGLRVFALNLRRDWKFYFGEIYREHRELQRIRIEGPIWNYNVGAGGETR